MPPKQSATKTISVTYFMLISISESEVFCCCCTEINWYKTNNNRKQQYSHFGANTVIFCCQSLSSRPWGHFIEFTMVENTRTVVGILTLFVIVREIITFLALSAIYVHHRP